MRAIETTRDARSPVLARGAGVALGVWLFASAFLWPHQGNVRYDDWLCGLFAAASALVAMWAPAFREVPAFIAVWLAAAVAGVLRYRSPATGLHDLVLAGAMLLASQIGGRGDAPPAP